MSHLCARAASAVENCRCRHRCRLDVRDSKLCCMCAEGSVDVAFVISRLLVLQSLPAA